MRLQHLSYSSQLKLHLCPRKYELYKYQAPEEDTDTDGTQSITFAYGHTVGAGVQKVLEGKPMEQVYWESFLEWECDLEARDSKRNKNFYLAMMAIEKFAVLCSHSPYLKDYELVIYKGKPAVELSFMILLPNGFKERGHVDAVLRHKSTGKILVFECKTSSSNTINPAEYKNSSQAIGYSIVLDHVYPGLMSYEVLYPVYMTKRMEWELFPFTKSYMQRAGWIQELLFDMEDIIRYEAAGHFPKRGESCYDFYRECEYLQTCGLSNKHLYVPLTTEQEQKLAHKEAPDKYAVVITLEQLIESQISKTNIKQVESPTVIAETEDIML